MTLSFRKLCILLAAGLFFVCSAAAEIESANPLLTPQVISGYTQTEDEFVNILLLGIDYGGKAWHTSGGKEKLEECHTDGVIVVSLNLTKDTISLISIPRDSLTYVPGVKGIYKFNGSINCADTLEEGFMRACDAASWHLGGIRVDKFVAVDATALIALGDAIGGVDFDVDMNYQGIPRKYENGMQPLDGEGILDYMYARQNATKDANDLGRTRRQRDMLAAIFAKVKREPALLMKALDVYLDGKLNILTNIGVADALKMAKTALSVDLGCVTTHVLEGPYRPFKMNFTFNDQEIRRQVIREVYGVDVPSLDYVSYRYTQWLTDYGLTAAMSINISRAILHHARMCEAPTTEQKEIAGALEAQIDACITAFDQAADTLAPVDTSTMMGIRNRMKAAAEAAVEAFQYPEDYNWVRLSGWYHEPMINEYQFNWN